MKNCNQIPDVDIIQSIINGDHTAFEILIRRHASCLYKLARSFGYSHEDAEDLLQETFISAYEHLKALRNRSYFKTWISRIMLNACYRKLRKLISQRKIRIDFMLHQQAVSDLCANLDPDTDKIVTRELNLLIHNAVRNIPSCYSQVFLLREVTGLSIHETALALNLSEINVKVRLSRAKGLLRKELEKLYRPLDDYLFRFSAPG